MSERRKFMFFFFQAEDGIRDYDVTGVQTCALPICEYAEAEPLYERSLAILEKAVGPEHPDVATNLNKARKSVV